MEPNKFEQHIKEEFNSREIQPTSKAWDKIVNSLDKPQQRKKTNYLWLGIAASFTGLLIISTIYFNTEKPSVENNNTVVDINKDSIVIKKGNINRSIESTEKSQIANTTIDIQETIKLVDKENNIKSISTNNYNKENEIAEVTIIKPQLEIATSKNDFSQKTLIQQKIAEVMAKVDKLEQKDRTLTGLEVDSLILQAQKEILQSKIFRQNQSVDAMALLYEVEDELDRPLKDQLFELLKKGVFETKNAIAARNN